MIEQQNNGLIKFIQPNYQEAYRAIQSISALRDKDTGLAIVHLVTPYAPVWSIEQEYDISSTPKNEECDNSNFYKFDYAHTNDHFLVHSNTDIKRTLAIHLSGQATSAKAAYLSYFVHKTKTPAVISLPLFTTQTVTWSNFALATIALYAPLYCSHCAQANGTAQITVESLPIQELYKMKYQEKLLDPFSRKFEEVTPKFKISDPDIRQIRIDLYREDQDDS